MSKRLSGQRGERKEFYIFFKVFYPFNYSMPGSVLGHFTDVILIFKITIPV